MPDFMRGDPKELLALIRNAIEDDSRIFHAGGESRNIDRGRIRVRIPAFRKRLHSVFHDRRGFSPVIGTGALRRIGGVIASDVFIRQIGCARHRSRTRVKHRKLRPACCPCEVPGQRARSLRTTGRVVNFSGVRIMTVVLLARAFAIRSFCVLVRTSSGFFSSPDPTIMKLDGTVT